MAEDIQKRRPVHVVGIRVEDRVKYAPEVQEILTRYGDVIVSRAGYHNPQSPDGIITMVVEAEPTIVQNLAKDLRKIEGVSAETCRLT
ncbi:MAG: hypothetical protein HPY52_04020 [Firmicutes bacterium]|nr:hypothetical protein [Bacillota bacterium]